MTDVIQNESIVAFNALNIEAIKNIQDLESMKMVLARLTGFEQALKEADRFFQCSVEFAKLEAAALIRAAELCKTQHYDMVEGFPRARKLLKGDREKAAFWLYNMNDADREKAIQRCENGMTIVQIYRLENKPTREAKLTISIRDKKDYFLEQAEKDGIIDISDFVETTNHNGTGLERVFWQDAKQGLRRTLLQAGFVGTGDGEQIYVNPKVADNEQIIKAIRTRLHSICNDICNVQEIAHTANILIPEMPQLLQMARKIRDEFEGRGEHE